MTDQNVPDTDSALLGVDVGNSSISIALLQPAATAASSPMGEGTGSASLAATAADPDGLDGVHVAGELRLPTQARHDESGLRTAIRDFCAEQSSPLPRRAVLCSVVPALTPLLTSTLLALGMAVHEVAAVRARDYGISVDIPDPWTVGSDLIADCVAARERESAVIVDTGTATKVLALQKGTFLGVTISPGPGLLGASLASGTAQLPDIGTPQRPATVLGHDTISAMRSGIYYQALGGIRETLSRVLQTMPDTSTSILTGGYSALFAGEQGTFTLRDPYFLHRGLWLIAQDAPRGSWQLPEGPTA